MPGLVADGNDLDDCIAVSKQAIDRARAGEGPSLVEIKTYRWEGHCRVIEDLPIFRPQEVVDWWHERDCIKFYSNRLIEKGILTEDGVKEVWAEALKDIDEAIEFGRKSPRPDVNKFMAKIQERYAL